MKHENYFNEFLVNHVNLNQSRLNTLEKRVETITNLLEEKLRGYRKYSPQGSYAHGTIIRPVQNNDEFDADILVFIKDDNFDPNKFTDYVSEVYCIFKEDGNYKDKVRKNTRSVKLDYAGDFHLDIVPCVEHKNNHYICNRSEEKFEPTDGDGYKEWLIKKNKIVGGNNFRKATRLFKFLRDHKDNFSIKSILLTTMLGIRIKETDSDSGEFSDLPTTLKILSNRINDYLLLNVNMPTIKNPVLESEDFNRHWDQRKYNNFRNKFDSYNEKINDAFEEKNHNESVKKWRKLFGDDFGQLREATKSKKGNSGSVIEPTIPTVAPTKPWARYD